MNTTTALALLLIVTVTIVGDWFLKHASMREGWLTNPWLIGGMVMYMASGIGFVIAMRHMTLAAVGVWYAVLTILFMTALGVVVFGEKLTARDGAGIVMALGALVLMTRFA